MKETIDIYIPRILGSICENYVKNSFHNLKIGKVIFIDMYRKINENGYAYYFAFITLELYDSKLANLLKERIITRQIMHVVYDEENNQYWEIKQHVPREHRSMQKNVKNTIIPFYNNVEKERLLNEYEELEKEIFAFVC
tara:strand:- start:21504 stop:21920 length:417 start_codon:yes stop_codon:yes gene_type:complete